MDYETATINSVMPDISSYPGEMFYPNPFNLAFLLKGSEEAVTIPITHLCGQLFRSLVNETEGRDIFVGIRLRDISILTPFKVEASPYGGPPHAVIGIETTSGGRLSIRFNGGLLFHKCSRIQGRYIVYRHLYQVGDEIFSYVGITRRSWQERYEEHIALAKKNCGYKFHQWLHSCWINDAKASHSVEILAAGENFETAMHLEEYFVEGSGWPHNPNCLNTLPGGFAGMRWARQHGAGVSNTDWENRELVIEKLSRSGTNGAAIAACWLSQAYAEAVICGPADRLKPEQIRKVRLMIGAGMSDGLIAAAMNTNSSRIANIRRGDTYSRIQ